MHGATNATGTAFMGVSTLILSGYAAGIHARVLSSCSLWQLGSRSRTMRLASSLASFLNPFGERLPNKLRPAGLSE